MSEPNARQKIVAAALDLAAGRAWTDVTLSDIARAAGLTLAEFRREFPSKGAILGAFAREIDEKVLASCAGIDLAQRPRDRIFEVLMARFDTLEPHKRSLRSIVAGVGRDPAMLTPVFNSQRWMLEAAGISADGPSGPVKLAGLAAVYASVLRTWLDDTDPGLAKTMAALDRQLRRGENVLEPVERGLNLLSSLFSGKRTGDRSTASKSDHDMTSSSVTPSSAALVV